MKIKMESKEVLYSRERNLTLGKKTLNYLINKSRQSKKKIIRVCPHKSKK